MDLGQTAILRGQKRLNSAAVAAFWQRCDPGSAAQRASLVVEPKQQSVPSSFWGWDCNPQPCPAQADLFEIQRQGLQRQPKNLPWGSTEPGGEQGGEEVLGLPGVGKVLAQVPYGLCEQHLYDVRLLPALRFDAESADFKGRTFSLFSYLHPGG